MLEEETKNKTFKNIQKAQKVFNFTRIHNRICVYLFNCYLSFCLPAKKKKNYYISLGTNCYARFRLSHAGIKPRKKEGELSGPFDLCLTKTSSIAQILENNFDDYIENIKFATTQEEGFDKYIYRNDKYNINYVHDTDLETLAQMKKRYEKRIKNFLTISKNAEELVYLQFIFNNDFTPEDLSSTYNSLKRLRNNKPFKFAVFSFVDNYTNIKEKLNPNIIFEEYIPDCGVKTYSQIWFKRDTIFKDSILPLILKQIDKL